MSTERSRLTNRCDEYLSKIVRKRDKFCITCGQPVAFNGKGDPVTLNCGHYIRRGALSLRWNKKNCNCQCPNCNGIHEYNIEPYRRKMIEKYGEGIIEELETIYRESRTRKVTTPELRELLKVLKVYYKEME